MMARPPATATTVVVSGSNYYYDNGVDHSRVAYGGSVQYQVVTAPVGAVITTLPGSCTTYMRGGIAYRQCGGRTTSPSAAAFRSSCSDGPARVTTPPMGDGTSRRGLGVDPESTSAGDVEQPGRLRERGGGRAEASAEAVSAVRQPDGTGLKTCATSTRVNLGVDRWRALLPAALLLVVAATQGAVTRDGVLVPWKGGGFGMFAATDGASFRRTRIVVERDGRSEETDVSPSLDALELKARLFPSPVRLERLAQAVVTREQRRDQPIDAVTVQVLRTVFGPDWLEPVEEVVRALEHRVR